MYRIEENSDHEKYILLKAFLIIETEWENKQKLQIKMTN